MTSNPHIKTAERRMDGVHEWQAEEGSTDATMIAVALDALTEAQLAVAYEARTANLVALWTAYDTRREPRKAHELLTQIEERLSK